MNEWFRRFSDSASNVLGSPWSFVLASLAIVIWAIFGPITNYSSDWQLWANTGTTLITFIAVFLIQNTQNRDSRALHKKIDELLKTTPEARDDLIDIEEAREEELEAIHKEFKKER